MRIWLAKENLRVLAITCVLLISSMANAFGGLILPGNDDIHIAMGAGHNYVGAFYRGTDSSNLSFAGSITLIDDGRWGLTTKHQVVTNFNDPTSLYGSYAASFGSNYLTSPGTVFSIQQVFVNPNQDLALIYFGNTVTGVNAVQRFTGAVTVGTEGYMTGFGVREYVNDTNPPVDTGDRRAGFDVIEAPIGQSNITGDVFRTRVSRSILPEHRPFEMGARTGDSGGAFVVGNELYGIMAGGSTFNIFGASTFYQIPDNTWVNNTIASVSSVPEPGSFVLLGVTFAAIGFARRKSQR